MIAVPEIYTGPILDRRRLTNVQRAAMGLSPRGHGGKRGPRVEKPEVLVELFDTPPRVRMEEQFARIIKKWAERGIR